MYAMDVCACIDLAAGYASRFYIIINFAITQYSQLRIAASYKLYLKK